MIKQSVINTFKRVGINYEELLSTNDSVEVTNWLTGETIKTDLLTKEVINKIYQIQLDYENGKRTVNLSDFDRLRYFVLEHDKNAFYTCID